MFVFLFPFKAIISHDIRCFKFPLVVFKISSTLFFCFFLTCKEINRRIIGLQLEENSLVITMKGKGYIAQICLQDKTDFCLYVN